MNEKKIKKYFFFRNVSKFLFKNVQKKRLKTRNYFYLSEVRHLSLDKSFVLGKQLENSTRDGKRKKSFERGKNFMFPDIFQIFKDILISFPRENDKNVWTKWCLHYYFPIQMFRHDDDSRRSRPQVVIGKFNINI